MRKLSRVSLLLCAVVGTLFGYAVTNAFIIEISVINFIVAINNKIDSDNYKENDFNRLKNELCQNRLSTY